MTFPAKLVALDIKNEVFTLESSVYNCKGLAGCRKQSKEESEQGRLGVNTVLGRSQPGFSAMSNNEKPVR